uniref:Uncharacterized protein n=1 Tax=Oryza sativa subsp. japonica TaxID=39947 RepID=Q69KQ3_ORYSJ|nr:hypothetical protein [Oryza sativa Japonica Group]
MIFRRFSVFLLLKKSLNQFIAQYCPRADVSKGWGGADMRAPLDSGAKRGRGGGWQAGPLGSVTRGGKAAWLGSASSRPAGCGEGGARARSPATATGGGRRRRTAQRRRRRPKRQRERP